MFPKKQALYYTCFWGKERANKTIISHCFRRLFAIRQNEKETDVETNEREKDTNVN